MTQSTFENPDFAFPQTVEKDASAQFSVALDERDGVKALKAAIQMVVARQQVSQSSFEANVSMIDSAANILPAPYSSLSYLLEATLYVSLYRQNAWDYNRRNLPTDSYPDDPNSWSGSLFAKKTLELIDKVSAGMQDAEGMPIAKIAPLLTDTKDAQDWNLTVYDFIVYRSVALLNSFGNGSETKVIPFRTDMTQQNLSYPDRCQNKGMEMLDALLSLREKDSDASALSVAVVQRAAMLDRDEKTNFLQGWAKRLSSTPWAATVLNEYYHSLSNTEFVGSPESVALYREMEDWTKRFPKAVGVGMVKYDMAMIAQAVVRIDVPDVMMCNTPGKGKVNVRNMNSAYVLIYKVPESMVTVNSVKIKNFPTGAVKIASIPLSASGEIPFSQKLEFDIPALEPGRYVALPSPTSSLGKDWRNRLEQWSIGAINVTDISIVTVSNSSQKDSGVVYVVDSRDQRPVAGASVKIYSNDGRKLVKSGVSDANGAFSIPKGYYRVKATKGKSVAEMWSSYGYYKNDEKVVAVGNIFTDLAIYKPGDRLQFGIVGWLPSREGNRLLKNESLSVVLRDANYNPVDTLSLTSDADGRCNGAFDLPKNGLLGTFTLEAIYEKYKPSVAARGNVEVAEYKAPGFYVEINADSTTNYKAGDLLKFTGVVKTYSGMPLDGADVKFNISWNPWWRLWHGTNPDATFGGEVKSDADGKFTISLPTENLKGTDFEYGAYTLNVDATSPSGETQKASPFRFSIGKGFSVNPSIPSEVCASDKEVRFNVPVYDILGLPVGKRVDYSVVNTDGDATILSGTFDSPTLILNSSDLPSGKYKLAFCLSGDTLKSETETVIWRKDDRKAPYKTPLWVPLHKIVASEGSSSVDVEFGSGYAGSWILAVVSGDDGIISREWVQIDGDNKSLSVAAPQGNERVWVAFSGMHEFNQKVTKVEILPASAEKKLSVKAESFRSNITSGSHEQWRFKFTVDGNAVKNIPAFAVMTDKSLNALSPFAWSFNVGRGSGFDNTFVSNTRIGSISPRGTFSTLPRYDRVGDPIPDWETYGYGFSGGGGRMVMYKTAARSAGVMIRGINDVKEESAEAEEVLVTVQSTSLNLAAAAPDPVDMAADEAVLEEGKVVNADGGAAAREEVELRPVEMPLAFFMPDLKGDADGNVSVEFDSPNFNTTWQFQIMGYTDDLLTAGMLKDAMSTKEVMVKSNPPRFVRTGDDVEVSALLFNNTDHDLHLYGEIELFDPMTGKTIASERSASELTKPSANRKIAVRFHVPTDLSAVGMRAYAYGENHSDGEQTVIPVLPSSTPVIESVQFYLGADKDSFVKRLPKFRKDANLTLKYCDNPIWECVLALPSISSPESKNVVALMRALYANSTALTITRKYPVIKSGIEKVLASDAMSARDALKSNLEKDAELKTVELINTPWVNNASAETLRMHSLNTLLDEKGADSAVASILDQVKGLQNSDGGWSWCPDMRSSSFMTREVLRRFGMMKKTGALPDGCNAMIRKGIAYCDKSEYDDYVKSKHEFSVYDMLDYLYVRSFFDAGNGPSGFSGLKNKALKRISEEWQKFSVKEKAIAAILMSRSNGYERTAGVILESLNQYASKDEAKGWWYDNLSSGYNGWDKLSTTATVLEAYSEISPKAQAVDGLRQWLVLQKETEDWGANSNTVEVIQSILSSGSDWSASTGIPEIKLGDNTLSLPEGEMLTGIMTLPISAELASGKGLTIRKGGDGPAWGGVISQYVAPMKDVKAESCENLKIRKQLLVVTDTPAGEVAKESQIKVGDKVRVTLTLTCDKDMNYVAITDERGAAFEPADQLSGYTSQDGLGIYREVRDSRTSFFIEFLPKGVNVITYDCYADREGTYSIGIASVQSQYSPLQVAHSAGEVVIVR